MRSEIDIPETSLNLKTLWRGEREFLRSRARLIKVEGQQIIVRRLFQTLRFYTLPEVIEAANTLLQNKQSEVSLWLTLGELLQLQETLYREPMQSAPIIVCVKLQRAEEQESLLDMIRYWYSEATRTRPVSFFHSSKNSK